MATSVYDRLFSENQISSIITEESALEFYREHGIYYLEDAEIGKLAANSGRALSLECMADLIALALKDQRARRIIEPFLAGSFKLYYVLGRDKGRYYAHTTRPSQEDHRIVIYMWNRGTRLEFAHKSHIRSFQGVGGANLLTQIPYVQLNGLNEFRINLDLGGMVIMHPRLAFTVEETQGTATGYVFELPETNPQTS